MKIKSILAILLLCLCSSVFAMDAVVTKVSGKAEVLKNGTWVALNEGSKLSQGDVIQTGFKSSLTLKIKESTVDVAALTRIKVEQLAEQESVDETSLFVDTGKVYSEVNKSNNRRVGFVVRSPVATASVRGTGFDVKNTFDGTEVDTGHGLVETNFTDSKKTGSVSVAGGQKTLFSKYGEIASTQKNAFDASSANKGNTQSAASFEAESNDGLAGTKSDFSFSDSDESGSGNATASISVTINVHGN